MQKIDVFLKTYDLAPECVKNIKRWISIFSPSDKYTIKIVIPSKFNPQANSIFSPLQICNDINLNLPENEKYANFFKKITEFRNPAIANLTCFKNAKSSFFWNIDADDTHVEMNSGNDFELLEKLQKIEKIVEENNYHAASLDFYRLWNCNNWLDHWSFGVCYMKNDLDTIVENLDKLKIYDRGFGINSDHLLDMIRHQINSIKIKSFGIRNSVLIHPTFGHVKGGPNASCVHKYNENEKETQLPCGLKTNRYEEAIDYIVI